MFVTNFHEQPDTLYRNQGKDGFSDVSWPAKIAQPNFPQGGLGHRLLRHGQRRLAGYFRRQRPRVSASGFDSRRPGLPRTHSAFPQSSRRNVSGCLQLRLPDIPPESRRGAAFGDINNDGNIDVVMVNVGAPPTLLLNQGGNGNHRVLFKLVRSGQKSNRSAIGARVTVKAGRLVQFSEVRAGGSYISQNDPRLHFGLGAEPRMNEVEIKWPSGKVEVAARRPGGFYLYACRRPGDRGQDSSSTAVFAVQVVFIPASSIFPSVGLCLSVFFLRCVRYHASGPEACRSALGPWPSRLFDRTELLRLALLLRHLQHLAIACTAAKL